MAAVLFHVWIIAYNLKFGIQKFTFHFCMYASIYER